MRDSTPAGAALRLKVTGASVRSGGILAETRSMLILGANVNSLGTVAGHCLCGGA